MTPDPIDSDLLNKSLMLRETAYRGAMEKRDAEIAELKEKLAEIGTRSNIVRQWLKTPSCRALLKSYRPSGDQYIHEAELLHDINSLLAAIDAPATPEALTGCGEQLEVLPAFTLNREGCGIAAGADLLALLARAVSLSPIGEVLVRRPISAPPHTGTDDYPASAPPSKDERLLKALEEIGAEIRDIMRTYREQAASAYGVDTPGGLEHLGDVWRLLGKWDAALAEPEAK